jgi:hypothetical protein
MDTVAYLVYGSDPAYTLELSYSVLSCARFLHQEPADIQIVLFTNVPYRGRALPLQQFAVTDDQLKTWTLDGTYKHAAKFFALSAALDHYKGSVALVDTDTVFLAHPKQLFARIQKGRSVMHAKDNLLREEPTYSQILGSIVKSANGYEIGPNRRMNNSGVLGVHIADRRVIDDVLPLIKELHAIDRVDTIEQFAFTAVLEKHTTLTVCPDLVRHYWGYERRFCHAQIQEFLRTLEGDLTNYVGPLPDLGYPSKPALAQIQARLKQLTRGASPEYRFAYLAYKCALASREQPTAEAWADTALDVLMRHESGNAAIESDFKQFSPGALTRQKLLGPATQQRWMDYWATLGTQAASGSAANTK